MSERKHRSEADYIDRTIATVRNHRGADNCWPQWANIFADEIEDLRADAESAERQLADMREALADGVLIAMQYLDTGRGDLDGWIEYAQRLAVSPADTTEDTP